MASVRLLAAARRSGSRFPPPPLLPPPDRQMSLAAWVAERNTAGRSIDWRFTTDDARGKLDHRYAVGRDVVGVHWRCRNDAGG